MSKSLIVIVLCIIVAQGCTNIFQHGEVDSHALPIIKDPSSKDIEIDAPEHIRVNGNFYLKLDRDINRKAVTFSGTEEDVKNIVVEKKGQLLDIHNKPGCYNKVPATIIVNASELESIQFFGNGCIDTKLFSQEGNLDLDIVSDHKVEISNPVSVRYLQAGGKGEITFKDLRSEYLSISARDSVIVKIQGKVKLTNLTMQDNSWMDLYWVESPFLRIKNKDQSFAKMAGKVNTVEVVLTDKAHLSGKYLRSDKVYAKTKDNARADISAKEFRTLQASDQSDIYNYRDTKFKSDFMSKSGTILNMVPSKG